MRLCGCATSVLSVGAGGDGKRGEDSGGEMEMEIGVWLKGVILGLGLGCAISSSFGACLASLLSMGRTFLRFGSAFACYASAIFISMSRIGSRLPIF